MRENLLEMNQKNCTENENISYIDLSIITDATSEIISTRYPERRTRLKLSFIKNSILNKTCMFAITIIRRVGDCYSAYDQSTYFLIKTRENLLPNKKYLVYGKVKFRKFYLLYAEHIELLNYKNILYRIL
ncbi:hypothetical protein H311_02811 [Anncaliia algerae PRA109]|nr:hypothetical protein H311_02811 [Anncaliia algerae PRA109]